MESHSESHDTYCTQELRLARLASQLCTLESISYISTSDTQRTNTPLLEHLEYSLQQLPGLPSTDTVVDLSFRKSVYASIFIFSADRGVRFVIICDCFGANVQHL